MVSKQRNSLNSNHSGKIHFATFKPECTLWLQLWHHMKPIVRESSSVANGTFDIHCMSSDEVGVHEEIELHICASLRHLSWSLENGRDSRRAGVSKGVSKGFLLFEALWPPNLDDDDDPDSMCDARSSTGCNMDSLNSPFPGDFTACFEQLVSVTWTVFIRAQLISSLLQGEFAAAAAWALRFIGTPDPWGFREVQELALQVLEMAASSEIKRPLTSGKSLFLQEAVLKYLDAPIIPRYRRRLSTSLSCFSEKGFFAPEETCMALPSKVSRGLSTETDSQCGLPPSQASTRSSTDDGCVSEPGQLRLPQKAFNCSIDVLIARLDNQDLPQSMDDVNMQLASLRKSDSLCIAWRDACLSLAAGHVEACHLNPRKRLVAEARGVISNSGTSWKPETACRLVNAMATTPQESKKMGREKRKAPSPSESRFIDVSREMRDDVCDGECTEFTEGKCKKLGPQCNPWCGSQVVRPDVSG